MRRFRLWLLLVLCLLLLTALIYAGGKRLQTQPEGAAIGGPFSLTAGDGKTVTDKSFGDKYLLIYFGFTNCPDTCPTTLGTMMSAVKRVGKRGGDIQPLFITVDPARDTPAVIGAYANDFGTNLIGLTGSPEQIAAVEKEYKVYAEKHQTGNGPNDYVMDHSSVLYLMAPDGKFVAALNADQSADGLGAEIKKNIE